MSKPPNFLFFMTDQHRADYLSCAGHPVLRTPNIDRIAESGTLFTRSYVANPVCMPNRAALMTGRLSSVNGVRQNGNDLPLHMTTFTQILQAGGYDTALLGKAHLQTMTDFPVPIGNNPAGKGALANAIDIGDESDYLSESNAQWIEQGGGAVRRADAIRDTLPQPRHGQRAVPDAWRQEHRPQNPGGAGQVRRGAANPRFPDGRTYRAVPGGPRGAARTGEAVRPGKFRLSGEMLGGQGEKAPTPLPFARPSVIF